MASTTFEPTSTIRTFQNPLRHEPKEQPDKPKPQKDDPPDQPPDQKKDDKGQDKPQQNDKPQPQKPPEMKPEEVQAAMKRQGIMPLSDTHLVVMTTNYSIAPGMVWMELTTPATFTASGTVKVALNPRGSGQLLGQGLQIPVAIAVIAPTPLPGTTPKHVNQVVPPATCTPLTGTPLENVLARLWVPGPLISGCEDEIGPAVTGMSVQGFPGFPRQLMPSGPTAVLPAAVGINRAYVDTTTSPFELAIVFVGSGSVPAGTRFLVMTITGV